MKNLVAALIALSSMLTWTREVSAAPAASVPAPCSALASADFVNIQDAPTQVTEAKLVTASGSVPALCQVQGYVAPNVGFRLLLPASDWNGKFLETGCGGFCGSTDFIWWCADPVHKGYACIVSDTGHQGSALDGLWALNNLQAQIDFGYRGAHVAALAGKAIAERFYGRAPQHSYFWGCSNGGGQALSEAQRFPWDFDGIIAGAPMPTFSGPVMFYLWAGRALAGTVSQANLRFVHDKVVAQCDMDDGVKDGVIGDPLHCKFDPAKLLCKSDEKKECLTRGEVEAVKKVYSGPTTSKGEKIYTGGPLPGSELNWVGESASAYVNDAGVATPWSEQYFAYMGFMPAPGPSWKPADFDFDRDYKRLRMAESLVGGADNPDLRRFKSAGGKLIMYQGGQDASDIPADAVDYYETAEKTMGGRVATQEFFRMFMVPGMDHCSGGDGAFAIDYLSYLESWVESGKAPDRMLGAHPEGVTHGDALFLTFPLSSALRIKFTRPVFPYPIQAKYKGNGDPNNADNFVPVERKSDH
jgi:hypothetical protein